MSTEQLLNKLKEVGTIINNIGIQTLENYITEERKTAANLQKENDIINAIVTLSDAGIKEQELYELLSKFWDVDSRKEAANYIKLGRYIEWPIIRLKDHLKNNDYTSIEIVKYMHNYNIREKLEHNPNLCELKVEQLKSKLEKL